MNLQNKEILSVLLIDKLESTCGVSVEDATPEDCYYALAYLIKDQIMKRRVQSASSTYIKDKKKQVYYFSLEFLLGRMLEVVVDSQDEVALGMRQAANSGLVLAVVA